jgi:hypothetical protein
VGLNVRQLNACDSRPGVPRHACPSLYGLIAEAAPALHEVTSIAGSGWVKRLARSPCPSWSSR